MPAQQLFKTIRDELQNGAIIGGDNYQAKIEILQPLVDGFPLDLPVRLVSYQNHNGAHDISDAVEAEVPYILGVRIRSNDQQGRLQVNAHPHVQANYLTLFADTVDTGVAVSPGVNYRADVVLYRRISSQA